MMHKAIGNTFPALAAIAFEDSTINTAIGCLRFDVSVWHRSSRLSLPGVADFSATVIACSTADPLPASNAGYGDRQSVLSPTRFR